MKVHLGLGLGFRIINRIPVKSLRSIDSTVWPPAHLARHLARQILISCSMCFNVAWPRNEGFSSKIRFDMRRRDLNPNPETETYRQPYIHSELSTRHPKPRP